MGVLECSECTLCVVAYSNFILNPDYFSTPTHLAF